MLVGKTLVRTCASPERQAGREPGQRSRLPPKSRRAHRFASAAWGRAHCADTPCAHHNRM